MRLLRPLRAGLIALPASILLAACGSSSPITTHLSGSAGSAGSGAAATHYQTTLRYTAYGIPHISANDYGGIGYGYGYALARDEICTMADAFVTVNGNRSRYFGPDKSWTFTGNGTVNNNLDSDFFLKLIADQGIVEKLISQPPPQGPYPQARALVKGMVAGYNRYLADTGVDQLSDPRCRGAAWVRPITAHDVWYRFYELALLASSGVAIDGIGSAQPPSAGASTTQPNAEQAAQALGRRWHDISIGSNAVALGSDATVNGHGALLGNPHFPWTGSERFLEAQLTIPGQMNVEGASLLGVPLILIGHTASVAWSHTVSSAWRFTPYQLTLVPGKPTEYLVDGKPQAMTAHHLTVQALQSDGTLKAVHRTLYTTRWGPLFTSLLGLKLFPWTPLTAYALADANAKNFRYVNYFYDVDHAQTVADVLHDLRADQGIPWVNTLAADNAGNALYADISVTPNVPNSKAISCTAPLGLATFPLLGLPVLDGSRSACAWDVDPDALQPGTIGPSHMPWLIRSDYVTNSNDSYWLSNPAQPLTGFARIIGDTDSPRSLRTRNGLTMVENRLDGSDGKAGDRFSLRDVQDLIDSDRQYAGVLWRDPLLKLCQTSPVLIGSSGPVQVPAAACTALAHWDLADHETSIGAILFRRFVEHLLLTSLPRGTASDTSIFSLAFTQPFSLADPVHTPAGLDTLNPLVQRAFADAITDLQKAGITFDAPLGQYQYETRGSQSYPLHGGPGTDGDFNALDVPWNPKKGYPNPEHGSSFIIAISFNGSGCPDTRSILTYSQSDNPESPHYGDQTALFSQHRWVHEAFCESEIEAAPVLQTVHLGQ